MGMVKFMDTQYRKKLEIDENDLIRNIYSISENFDFSYLFSNYIDRNHWNERIQNKFIGLTFENLTDTNYSRCFNFAINLSDPHFKISDSSRRVSTDKLENVYRIEILISFLGPYLFFRFFQYNFDTGAVNLKSSFNPFKIEHTVYKNSIFEFCAENNLFLISDRHLTNRVNAVKLELSKESTSVYNFLFEDNYSTFPYDAG